MLAGIFYFDSRPVNAEDKAQILAGVADGFQLHVAPGLAMLRACGPHTRECVCSFAGRLDNVKDLRAACEGSPIAPSPSQLVLARYRKKGHAAFSEIIGDWSVAIWDASEHAMLLASDYAGVRPLYYCRTAASLKWSSSLEHLLNWAGSPGLDEDYVAGIISGGRTAGKTPYQDIECVQAGTFLRAARDSFAISRFWNPPTHASAPYGSEEECAERLRSLLEEAVAVRLDTSLRVSAELSGGLDSSSIVCIANRMVTSGACTASGITSFSYHSAGTNDAPFIRAVEEYCQSPGIHMASEEFPPIGYPCAGGSAPHFGAPRFSEVSRRMAAIGSNILLTGQLGDLVMGNWLDDSEQAADYLRQGRVVRAFKESFAWSRSLQVPVYPILWRALRPDTCALDRTGGDRYESLTSAFRQRAESLNDANLWWECPRGVLPSHGKRLRALMSVLSSGALRSPDTLTGAFTTHPFAHRPLVEFMISAPSAFLCRPDEPRRLMRRALKGIVPDAVLRRRSKGNYEAMFLRALRACAVELLRDPREMQLVESGYLERAGIEDRLRNLIQGLPCNVHQLRQMILLEVWLRQTQERFGNTAVRGHGHQRGTHHAGVGGRATPAYAAAG